MRRFPFEQDRVALLKRAGAGARAHKANQAASTRAAPYM
jgi:hypothetical protein